MNSDMKIIVFEGLDNSFKETNYARFVEKFKKENSNACVYTESFPRYGNQMALGVEKWLDGSLDRNHLMNYSDAVNSLYSIDRLSYWFERVHGQKRNIDKLYNSDKPVFFIFDRYTISNAIYNPYNGVDTSTYDLTFDRDSFGIPQADICVWMRMNNFDVLKSLIAQKSGKDANELDTEFIRSVWERSERVIASNNFEKVGIKLVVIECLDSEGNIRSKDDIATDIWTKVCNALNEKGE